MKYRCTRCGKPVTFNHDAIVVGPNDDPVCDACWGEKRDSQGRLVDVMADYRRGWAGELLLYGIIGIILGILAFAAADELGLLPYLWRLIP